MDVRTCRKCKRIFNYLTGPMLCPSCREKMEIKFQEVKNYIEEHRGATIPEVAEACEVETAQIQQWLKDDRLELTEGSSIMLTCESCGVSIRSGRYCEKCKGTMTNSFKNILQSSKPQPQPTQKKNDKENPKMRFL